MNTNQQNPDGIDISTSISPFPKMNFSWELLKLIHRNTFFKTTSWRYLPDLPLPGGFFNPTPKYLYL